MAIVFRIQSAQISSLFVRLGEGWTTTGLIGVRFISLIFFSAQLNACLTLGSSWPVIGPEINTFVTVDYSSEIRSKGLKGGSGSSSHTSSSQHGAGCSVGFQATKTQLESIRTIAAITAPAKANLLNVVFFILRTHP